MNKVLLVDDDTEVLEINQAYLRKKGLDVICADNAADALEAVKSKKPDCIVLDVMMPSMDGYQLFEKIRNVSEIPVLFLSGKSKEEDRLKGLRLGAVDYIVKPCSLEELLLRINIHLSKKSANQGNVGLIEYPPLRIDLLSHKVYYEKEELPLPNREYDLLVCLAKNPGEIMTYEVIGKEVFQTYLESDRKNIMVNASRLRKRLEDYVGLENLIETIWGTGYRFHG